MHPLLDWLDAAVRTQPGRPLLTSYDDATGHRVELSAATLDNWVAKTGNMLRDGFGVGPGDVVGVALPAHWQAVVVVLGAWRIGAAVDVADDPAAMDRPLVVCTDEARMAAAQDTGADVVVLALAPFGGRLPSTPPGVTDFAEVLAYGDVCPTVTVAPGALATPAMTVGSLAASLDATAARHGLAAEDRTEMAADGWDLWSAIAALRSGDSLVLVVHGDPSRAAQRRRVEGITRTLRAQES